MRILGFATYEVRLKDPKARLPGERELEAPFIGLAHGTIY